MKPKVTMYWFLPILRIEKRITYLWLLFVLMALSGHGQSINFTLPDASSGKLVSLTDYKNSNGVLVIFTSNTCPFDEYYRNRIAALQKKYGDKVPVVLINSHTDEQESLPAMKTCAAEKNITMPYLADKDQAVMNQFGARKSPEAFLLQNNKGIFTIIYHGAIDDNAQSENDVKVSYVQDAIDRLLKGQKPAVSEQRPVGCSIR